LWVIRRKKDLHTRGGLVYSREFLPGVGGEKSKEKFFRFEKGRRIKISNRLQSPLTTYAGIHGGMNVIIKLQLMGRRDSYLL